MLIVQRLTEGTKKRGGGREMVARISSVDYLPVLQRHGAGRYRVTCIGRDGRFLKRGVCTIEVSPETLTVHAVRARISSDYPRRVSSAAAEQREVHRVRRRVAGLEEKLRVSQRESATLRRDGARREEQHLIERLQHKTVQAVATQFEQLQKEVLAAKAALAAMRDALAEERRLREESERRMTDLVAQIAWSPPPPSTAPVDAVDEPWAAVEPVKVALVDAVDEVPVAEAATRKRRKSPFEALETVRNVGGGGRSAPTGTEAPRAGLGERLARYLEDPHRPRKR